VLVLPHALLTEYIMVSIPVVLPVTTPLPVTVALVLLLLQVPLPVVSVSVIEAPLHTTDAPVITPADAGTVLMFITAIAVAVPQVFVTPYMIVSTPTATTGHYPYAGHSGMTT